LFTLTQALRWSLVEGERMSGNKPFQRPHHPKRGRRYIDAVDRYLNKLFGEPLGHWVPLGRITPYAEDMVQRANSNHMTICLLDIL